MLERYFTGVPTWRGAGGSLAAWFLRPWAESYSIPLSPALVSHNFVATMVRKAAGRVLNKPMAHAAGHRADGLFDRMVCRTAIESKPQFVVAYENSALRTFEAAKQAGIVSVLDAASVHHTWQDRYVSPTESPREHARIVQRKDAEIALADHILCTSQLAQESYLEAGVPAERLHVAPLGVDAARFKAPTRTEVCKDADEVRFVYVGSAAPLKGLDVLREAAKSVRSEARHFQVTLIGAAGAVADDGFLGLGWLSHDRLAAELPNHDVLVLPSRFDSFGMVVAEAMACGLPVIVTDHVGAKEMVTPGENGLIVPAGDATALAGAIAWMIDHRDRIPAMRASARAAAERYDWSVYRRRVVELFQQWATPR